MAKKPDAVFTSLWGGHFVTFVKQAKPLQYFEAVKFNVLAAGEAGAIETAKAMGDDYPVGIWANAYDAFNWDGGRRRTRITSQRLRDVPEGGASVVVADHRLHRHADAGGGDRRRPDSTDSDKVAKAMLDITVDTPIGKQTIRAQGPPGQSRAVLGQDDQGPASIRSR